MGLYEVKKKICSFGFAWEEKKVCFWSGAKKKEEVCSGEKNSPPPYDLVLPLGPYSLDRWLRLWGLRLRLSLPVPDVSVLSDSLSYSWAGLFNTCQAQQQWDCRRRRVDRGANMQWRIQGVVVLVLEHPPLISRVIIFHPITDKCHVKRYKIVCSCSPECIGMQSRALVVIEFLL